MLTDIVTFKVDDNGAQANGIVIRPDAVNSYPTIFFFPGDGQKGNGTTSTVGQLYDNGSPLSLARDGKLPGFTVIGVQGVAGRGIQADQLGFAFIHYFKPSYKIGKVMICGLSLGAQETFELAGSVYAGLFDFAVPMSTPSPNTDLIDWERLKAQVLIFHGDKDSGLTDYWESVRLRDSINAVKPGMAYLITFPGGHGPWAPYFSPDFRFTIGDITYNGIYDFYNKVTPEYRFPKQAAQTNGTTMPAKPVLSIRVSGSMIACDPTGTTGVSSWDLKLIDENGLYFKPDWMGATSGNNNPTFLPTANNVRKGKGSVVFTCQPGNVVVKQDFEIGGLTQPPPTPIKTAIAIIPNAKTGNTTYVYDDDTTDKRVSQ